MFSKWIFQYKNSPHDLIDYGHMRIRSIIQCNKVYDNGIHEKFQAELYSDNSLIISSNQNYQFINQFYIMRITSIQQTCVIFHLGANDIKVYMNSTSYKMFLLW